MLFVPVATGLPAQAADGDGPPGRAAARVEKLYRDAAEATRDFEAARKASDAQHDKVQSLRKKASAARKQLQELRVGTGRMARSQYRNGGLTPATRLLFSDSPSAFLRKSTLLRQGDQAAARMLLQLHRAQQRLATDQRHASRALTGLKKKTARQDEIRDRISRKLNRAQQRLRSVRAAQTGPMRLLSTASTPPTALASPKSSRHNPDGWVVPVKNYTLSSGFASSGNRWANRHTGQDFAVPTGTPVRAASSGTVVSTNSGDAFGNSIVIRHPNGYHTQYAHLSTIGVQEGQKVRTGQEIGRSGSTGNSTGPHLHFEVRVTEQLGSGVDPVPWLREHGVKL